MNDPRSGAGWEMAVMGTVLADPHAMDAAESLSPQDFTGSHRSLWLEIIALHRRNALDPRALVEGIRSSGDLDIIGADHGDPLVRGENYIEELLTYRGAQIDEYVARVIDHATRRQLRETAALIAADAMGEKPSDDLLDEAERRIMALRRARGITGVSLGAILQAYMPRMHAMIAGTARPAFVPRVSAVRDIVGHFDDNDFVLVAGRPGEGKSSYLRFEAFWKAKEGIPGIIFNLENDEAEYAKGALALETGIDSFKMREPRLLTNADKERIQQAAQDLMALPIEIVTLGGPSVTEIERIARAKMRAIKPKWIMVDYIQLINNGIENRVQDVSMSSQALRAMAMKNRLGVPVIAACQLSRAIENRPRMAPPELSDLRESGSLEQDATIVVFVRSAWSRHEPPREEVLRFPENRDPETGGPAAVLRSIPVQFHVAKNRNGPIGVSERVKWGKHTGQFQTLMRTP